MSQTDLSTSTAILLRRREAARVLGVSESLLCRLDKLGELHPVKLPGLRSIRYENTEVRALAERWIRDGRQEAASA